MSTLSRIRYLIFPILCLSLFGRDVSTTSKDGLSICGLAESSSRLIFVSTLDGKLTALNPNNDGAVLWTIHPGSESMLSSSIHKLELSNYGHLVRMIPSLNGGLYKFNGENIELIPVTSEHLLESSLRYSDDLVISGGKETLTFGVSLETGHIIYECSMKGCGNVSHSTNSEEILVVQKQIQVVRAVEPRTGTERWNYSVAHHDLKLVTECPSYQSPELNYNLNVVIPEGIIYASDTRNPSNVFWKQKFTSPVVSAWQLNKGKLVEVDIFSNHAFNPVNPVASPKIYIGMFNKQLYIQESVPMLKRRAAITSKGNQNAIVNSRDYPVIPWKPISASNSVLGLTWQGGNPAEEDLSNPSQRQTTALSVLYASPYVDGSGFFLYAEDDESEEVVEGDSHSAILPEETAVAHKAEAKPSEVADSDPGPAYIYSDANTSVEIVVVSFWYYWKEVLVISITTAVICNFMITNRYLRWKFKVISRSLSTGGSTGGTKTDSDTVVQDNDSGIGQHVEELDAHPDLNAHLSYTSRYLTDFDPVVCLGKGGFGVVFEAKNKIDDCHYAIKRILLPRREDSRDRVLREVKALAKLDHHHIVRYFNAWTECPPSGWQEKQDQLWIDTHPDGMSDSELTQDSDTTVTSTKTGSALYDGLNSSMSPSSSSVPRDDFKFVNSDVSDSFVVFDAGPDASQSQATTSASYLNSRSVVDFETEKSTTTRSVAAKPGPKKPDPVDPDETSGLGSPTHAKVYLYIQMQLCQRHSLRDWLTVNSDRDYTHVLNIFEQILQAVEHVHLHGLIHRDLKPSNIFFSLDNQIKVGDFGLVTAMTEDVQATQPATPVPSVRAYSERHTAQVGTQLYMSREQLTGKRYNYKVDIYSLGLILFELLVPFGTQMERIHVLQNVKNDKFPDSFQKTYKKEFDLLRLMLSDHPEDRPTTYGVRARLPLKQDPVEENWHFELPTRGNPSSKPRRHLSSFSGIENLS